MKPIYAFDIDGVLCDTRAAHKECLEEDLGVTLEDGGDYAHFGFKHEDETVMTRLREIALDVWRRPRVVKNGTPSGAETLFQLFKTGQLAGYVTRRQLTIPLYESTVSWLLRHDFTFFWGCGYLGDRCGYPSPEEHERNRQRRERFKEDVFKMHEDRAGFIQSLKDAGKTGKSLITVHHMMNDTDSKADIARQMGATHLVEDSPREAVDAAIDGINVVVIRRGYNADLEKLVEAAKEEANAHGLGAGYYDRITFISELEELL